MFALLPDNVTAVVPFIVDDCVVAVAADVPELL